MNSWMSKSAFVIAALVGLASSARGALDPAKAQELYERVTPSLVPVKFTWDSELGRRELTGAGVVVSDDNRYAFVSHMVGQGLERVDLTARTSKTLYMSGAEEVGEGPGEGSPVVERHACQGFALAKLEPAAAAPGVPTGRIFALQVLAATGDASQQTEGYGGGDSSFEPEVLDVAVIDEDKGEVLGSSLVLHRVFNDTRCALPRAAATSLGFLGKHEGVIAQRASEKPDASYTAKLLAKGINKVAQKVGEEGVETALAGVNESDQKLVEESADLVYHLLVLLRARGVKLEQVVQQLEARHRK
jgi:phosphoribosyl-ATP pyrophosphohydrolase